MNANRPTSCHLPVSIPFDSPFLSPLFAFIVIIPAACEGGSQNYTFTRGAALLTKMNLQIRSNSGCTKSFSSSDRSNEYLFVSSGVLLLIPFRWCLVGVIIIVLSQVQGWGSLDRINCNNNKLNRRFHGQLSPYFWWSPPNGMALGFFYNKFQNLPPARHMFKN